MSSLHEDVEQFPDIKRSDSAKDTQPPAHWGTDGEVHPIQLSSNPRLFIRQVLCVICFGCANLRTVWEKSEETAWKNTRDDVNKRLKHLTLVVRLS